MQVGAGGYVHSSRFYFSIQHIKSACLFAQFSFNIETLGDGRSREERLTEQTAYVTGSILSSVAFLEATINEVYADAADGMLNARKLDAGDVRRLGILWETEAFERRAGILEKLQVALTFADSQAFDAGVAPYQDARLLIKLRNFIVHAKPEWITAGVKKGKVPNLEELVLTPVGGQTRVSDVNADEGRPRNAGSNTTLPARIQTRSRSPCPLLAKHERCPDSQGATGLGQLSAELGQAG